MLELWSRPNGALKVGSLGPRVATARLHRLELTEMQTGQASLPITIRQ